MADGYLESRYAEYERRKAAWEMKRKNKPRSLTVPRPLVEKPEDEAL